MILNKFIQENVQRTKNQKQKALLEKTIIEEVNAYFGT